MSPTRPATHSERTRRALEPGRPKSYKINIAGAYARRGYRHTLRQRRAAVLPGLSPGDYSCGVTTVDPDLALNYLPRLPRRKDWRIGCAGAGFIMADCHLVA